MATITQSISNFPLAPDSTTDTPTEFNSKADAFVNHQAGTYVGEVNTWASQANAVRDDINNISASIPDGTINDTEVALTSTYSSEKILNEIDTAIETITVADGTAIKFPDGTMVCIGVDPTIAPITTPLGSLFRSASIVVTYPVPFVSIPTVIPSTSNSAFAGSFAGAAFNTLPESFTTRLLCATSTTGPQLTYTAIGRWK